MFNIDDIVKGAIEDPIWNASTDLVDACFAKDQMSSVSKLLFLNGDAYNNGGF